MTSRLEFRDVSVAYGPVPAVRGVSLRVHTGEIVGLAGRSGSGKSTLALAALRLLPPHAELTGQVLVGGADLATMSWGQVRAVRWNQLSIVFQSAVYGLNPVRTVGSLIAEPLRLRRAVARRRSLELLAEVGLPARVADAYPHQLSGGQRQRAMIAMALACEPDIVIADEATTALDVIVQAQVLEVLTRVVAEQRLGLLLISHDRSMLASVCGRVVVLDAGRVVDAPDDLPAPAERSARLPPGEPLLLARKLTVRVRTKARRGRSAPAVDRVGLDLRRGEIVAVAGETGCGKTTLARALLGLIRPDDGEVVYRGESRSRDIQFVPQDPGDWLNPRYSVYEAVAEGVRVHRLDNERERVITALRDAGLTEDFADRYPAELSGGQRQRVVIAGTLVLRPKVLIADEPVSSLDPVARAEFLELLVRLRDEQGIAALVVTHDLPLARQVADRIAIMYLGRVVEEGPVEQVMEDPAHPYTRALLSAIPRAGHPPRSVLPAEPPDLASIPSGCRFHPRCPVLGSGQANDLPCRTVEPAEQRIDDRRVACHHVAAQLRRQG